MKKRIVERAGVVGTAVVTLGLAGCGGADPVPQTPESEVSPPEAQPEPADVAAPDMEGESEGATEPEGEGSAEDIDTGNEAAGKPHSDGPDCEGADQFTEACGYASPTKYAALDSKGIVNA